MLNLAYTKKKKKLATKKKLHYNQSRGNQLQIFLIGKFCIKFCNILVHRDNNFFIIDFLMAKIFINDFLLISLLR